jgi:ribosomal protein L11 methylase PrmA
MKKTLLLLCTVLLTVSTPVESLFAQTEKLDKKERKERRELLMSLKNEKEINVIIDFFNTNIHGKRESDFVYIEDISTEEDWATLWQTEYKPSLFRDLLGEYNSQMFDYGYRVKFGNFENAKYQIRLVVTSIMENGTTYLKVYVEQREQQKILCSFIIIGNGGTFGSKINLMGDGFKRAGKELAKQTIKLFERGRATGFIETY